VWARLSLAYQIPINEVRRMTLRDIAAMNQVLEERAIEESREAAMAESRAKAQAATRGR
jgi:hypothetical protein